MNLADAITQVRYRLGNRTNLDAARITNEFALTQTSHEGNPELPWFLMNFGLDLVTVSGQNYVNKPGSYLREHFEFGGLWVLDASGTPTPLTKDGQGNLYSRQFGTGAPRFYADGGDRFFLFSTPDAAYNLKCNGYVADTAIATGMTTNLWLTHRPLLLVAEVCARLAGQLQMPTASIQMFVAEANAERARMDLDTLARDEAWRNRNMGAIDAGNFSQ